ncbi:transcriptional regulator MtlR [Clostridium pasteurianum DSM 525 = ATCC 6013]|uniref:Transcriptional antiterminator, BglG n=1 Tax=Clostridium pasteurianum DSM 525 = ATCC 6013 TaxID=1262449 RepID=A0A0H3J654_CLOPA|nr:BglG family transcription antiterminator [Clostridium pasteurianum]AJA48949.1 transcriptional regulator MtlR [Clostridium pasteurianum DSM 525 = ATCC 6013]AJA52937.1 transcriptional regulator MtlR [Clostridium pasteurianum DSM 525 = ATCC 6013]AOZ76158.1 transcription antiterminator BglG [Clostridium pasteurianum DSM 525 = ATCC 6013]AOZ79954.1 transcription antiterminator BglG [Clostridium pasteurianum]ELP60245.1 transcriptional antiterminator BglG [Clostridium pasteurianum DSM 525 = ATCC 60
MEGITTRQQFTLNKILNEETISLDDLHKQLEISERTILREISSINKFLRKYHLSIYYDNNSSLIVSGNKEKIQELKESLSSVPLQWLINREQRQIIIACELLVNKEPVKASYYSNKFNVVLGSISLDLDGIAKWAVSKKLCLIRNRNIGIIIEGSEWNKRNALIDLIFKYRPYEELLAFLYEQKFDQNIKLLFNMIFGENITDLGRKILASVDLSQFDLNDIKYLKLFIQMLLAIKKEENKDEIHLPDKLKKDTMMLRDYKKIQNFNKILKENNVNLIEDELIYMWFNLTDYKSLFNKDDGSSYIDYEVISKEIIQGISSKINVSIENDKQLIKDLSQHFRRTFNALNLGLKVINPLTNEIEQHYSELFNVVNNVSRLVFSRYNLKIPKEEVGYITLHIDVALQRKQSLLKKLNVLIVCPSGIGSARILESKIKFIFPDIGNISIKALHHIDKYIEDREYDLILFTVPIKLAPEIKKVIVVSPFMIKEDIEKINEFILNLKVTNETNNDELIDMQLSTVTDNEYETANTIIKNLQVETTKANTIENLVDFVVDDIKNLGLIKDKEVLRNAILKREEKGNIVVQGTNVALLHTRIQELTVPFVGVYHVKEPIISQGIGFSKESVNTFLVMIARNEESNYILQFLGRISIALIENKEFIENLKSSNLIDIRKQLINIGNDEGELK